MKSYSMICFFLSLAMIICPLCSVEKATNVISQEFLGEEITVPQEETAVATVKVMNASSKNITEMPLRDYLIGVVASEINAAYHEEAIKAQCVAAHTMLLYSKEYKNDGLNGADISDSSATHQGYLTEDEQREKWGENYDAYREKIEKCVDEVIDFTIQYDGKPINAVFHSISNGQTENATDVWGGEYPYLISVNSVGDKLSPAYNSEVKVTAEKFKGIMSENGAKLSDEPSKWVEKITNTDTGMVKEIIIGGKAFKGTEIRTLLGLKSSTFTVKYTDENFVFTVSGYGHGVGMSQYGADYMARQGFTYKEILKHYYAGTEISAK